MIERDLIRGMAITRQKCGEVERVTFTLDIGGKTLYGGRMSLLEAFCETLRLVTIAGSGISVGITVVGLSLDKFTEIDELQARFSGVSHIIKRDRLLCGTVGKDADVHLTLESLGENAEQLITCDKCLAKFRQEKTKKGVGNDMV